MRKITLSRPQKIQFPFTKGKILIDGSECETVKAGKTVVFDIPDGFHEIQVTFASLPPTISNILVIEESDGDVSFEVKIKVPMSNSGPTYAELTRK